MSTKPDPYASEEETAALIQPDTRTPEEKKLDKLMDERGAWEQGADSFPILWKIALELLAKQDQGEPVAYIHRNEFNEYRLEPTDNFKIQSLPVGVEVMLHIKGAA